jgi:hypothetical protein
MRAGTAFPIKRSFINEPRQNSHGTTTELESRLVPPI